MKTTQTKILKKSPVSLRRAKTRFKFDKERDDHAIRFDTMKVFAPSNILYGVDNIGVFGSPVVVLRGYAMVKDEFGNNSVVASADQHIVGRCVELSPDEVARMDDVAEQVGDYHRFLADVVMPQTGYEVKAWVYQARSHATPVEIQTSAVHSDTLAPAGS